MTEAFARAVEHHRAGRLRDAAELYQQILSAQPDHADSLHLLGVVFNQSGRPEIALDLIGQAVARAPDNPVYHTNYGEALRQLGRLADAETSFRRALALAPSLAEAHGNLATVLRAQGRSLDAVVHYRQALVLKPTYSQAHNNLGNVLVELGQLDEAISHYEQALALAPRDAEIHVNLAHAQLAQSKVDDAVRRLEHANLLRPDDALRVKIALALPIIPASTAEIAARRQALLAGITSLRERGLTLLDPEQQVGVTSFHLAYHALDDLPLQRAIAALYVAACPALTMVAPHCSTKRPAAGRVLRIGFISHFFYEHTIGRLFQGLIAGLSRARFHVTLFVTPHAQDPMRQTLLRSADAVVELPLNLAQARAAIADRALDILVYTDIGMSPLTYFLAFARLAPMQCVSWGHPDTTGIANLDYFLSCDAMEPEAAERHYSETLVRLPGPTIYYERPVLDAPLKDRTALGLPEQAHLYVCPQSPFKFHPDFDQVLIELLRRDPLGRLVLLQGAHPEIGRLLTDRMTASAPEMRARIILLPPLPRSDFLAVLATADVMLDPLHYSGGNSSLEALAFGTPIVTWPGEFMRGRHTAGFYRLMGLDDGVARDADHYVDLALRLGTDAIWRATVRERILAANNVLFENAASVRALEDFLIAAYADL